MECVGVRHEWCGDGPRPWRGRLSRYTRHTPLDAPLHLRILLELGLGFKDPSSGGSLYSLIPHSLLSWDVLGWKGRYAPPRLRRAPTHHERRGNEEG